MAHSNFDSNILQVLRIDIGFDNVIEILSLSHDSFSLVVGIADGSTVTDEEGG